MYIYYSIGFWENVQYKIITYINNAIVQKPFFSSTVFYPKIFPCMVYLLTFYS